MKHRGTRILLLGAALVAMTCCTRETGTKKGGETPKVGELERLGKGGRDFLVLGVDAPGFDTLSRNQKILIYYLYRAAIAGHTILDQQNHRYALEIRNLLEAVHLHSDGLEPKVREAVHDYLKYLWINHGPYDHDTHAKTLPNLLTPAMLRQAVDYAAGHGALIEVSVDETVDDKLRRLEPVIFDPKFEPLRTNQNHGDDIIATSAVNLYEAGLDQKDLDTVPHDLLARINVRFAKEQGKVAPQFFKIGGLYSEDLRTVSHFLQLAIPYAETGQQRLGLQALVEYYATGDEEKFREYSIHWLKSDTVVDYLNGFVESYMDPRGVIGQFEANAAFVSDSSLIGRLAENAMYFESRMPWPDEYKLDQAHRPVAKVVHVVVETGDSGPVSPAAYNLPNYSDIRRDHGSKNIVLLNIENARSEEVREAIIREFYLPEYRDTVRTFGDLARQWEVYMHEVIGHGSGRTSPRLASDPAVAIGRAYASLEECRADLVALYHATDPKLVEIGAFPARDHGEVVRAMYIGYLQGQLNRLRMYEDDVVREAHQRGSQLILSYLLEGGERGDQDYGVRMLQPQGDFFVQLDDVEKARRGVGDILRTLQTIKAEGDAAAASRIFDRFGTRVSSAWRSNIRSRAAKLNLPNKSAFVFPRLEPVLQGDTITDVLLHNDEDLTTQQLRFSRLRFNKRVPE